MDLTEALIPNTTLGVSLQAYSIHLQCWWNVGTLYSIPLTSYQFLRRSNDRGGENPLLVNILSKKKKNSLRNYNNHIFHNSLSISLHQTNKLSVRNKFVLKFKKRFETAVGSNQVIPVIQTGAKKVQRGRGTVSPEIMKHTPKKLGRWSVLTDLVHQGTGDLH